VGVSRAKLRNVTAAAKFDLKTKKRSGNVCDEKNEKKIEKKKTKN